LRFLRPVVSKDGHISAFGPRNLLLIVDSAVNIEKIMSILKRIDQPPIREEEAKIHVYFLEHVDATDLAEVLERIIKNVQATKGKKTPLLESMAKISITPEKATNSLIIVAPLSEYQNIAQIIKTLDKRRKQVFVETMIVEASIDKLKELGAKWRATVRHGGEPVIISGVGTISSSAVLSMEASPIS